MRLRSISLAAVALLASAVANAAPLTYTNIDVGLISTELDEDSLDGSGLWLRGSYQVHPSAFLYAELSDIGYDNDVDGFAWAVGAGGHVPVTPALDLVGTLAFMNQDIDTRGGSNSEDGYLLSVTARGFIVDKLELEGGIRHVNLSDSGSDTGLIGEGRYFFTPRIAGGVIVQLGDRSTFGINARFTF